MTIYALDTETYKKNKQGLLEPTLDCTQFTLGAIKQEQQQKTEFFHTKEEMWNHIKIIAKRAENRNKIAYIYAHNAVYDFYTIAQLEDKNIKIISHTPFIATYNIQGKERIKFLDSMAIWPTSLKKIGELLQDQKKEMPKQITNTIQLKEYLQQDVNICLESILHAKQLLKQNRIKVRRIYTIGQIAICHTLQQIKNKMPKEFKETFFLDERNNTVWPTKHDQRIRGAYRGGIIHAKKGTYPNVTAIDFNGLYQTAATQIRFPKLNTERLIKEPLRKESQQKVLQRLGISRAALKNRTNEHGILQIRTPKSNYIPTKDKTIIGTWTNEEIQTATQNGYELIDIEWSIVWEETLNPYKEIIPELNKLKEQATNQLHRQFYKNLANHSFGKFAQRNTGDEIIIDSIEEYENYSKRNYNMKLGIPNTTLMIYDKKSDSNEKTKPYYAPIIPTLINAKARLIMYETIKKIRSDEWLYTDTDSIITNNTEITTMVNIGNDTGQYKITHTDEKCKIRGRKTYSIGNQVKISGVRNKDITSEQFEKGHLTTQKMQTLLNNGDINQVGKFITETRDLNELEAKQQEIQERIENDELYIDHDITNIDFFLQNKQVWKTIM